MQRLNQEILAAGLATILVTPFIGGATSRIVAASYLGGELKAGPAMRATGRRFLVLLAVFFFFLAITRQPCSCD